MYNIAIISVLVRLNMVVIKLQRKRRQRTRKSKRDSLGCEVCGLSVVVKEVGGIAVAEEPYYSAAANL